MGVVGDNQQRSALAYLGEKLKHGEGDKETVGCPFLRHAEGGPQCVSLRGGQGIYLTELRQQELV